MGDWIPFSREELEHVFAAFGYAPREEDQWPSLLSPARVVPVGGGEQGGKSINEGEYAAAASVSYADEIIWIVGPDYAQCKKEFEYALRALEKGKAVLKDSIWKPQEGGLKLKTITNTWLVTKTAEEVQKLAGDAPILILMVEAGQQGFDVFEQLFGRTAPKGTQIRPSGTFEKASAWFDGLHRKGQVYPNDDDVQSFSVPSWNNKVFYPGGYDDPKMEKLRKHYTEREFLRRFAGKPPPMEGQVYLDYNPAVHNCAAFEIPSWYFRFRVLDAGISDQHPFCCLWVAVSEKRDVVVYRELHLKNHTIEQAAEKVKTLSGNEQYKMNLIDPSAFSRSRQSGWTDAKEFSRFGILCHPANSRDSARISRVIHMLRVNKIKIFDSCVNLIRTLPLQVWDTKVGAEKRDSRIEDDPVDCLEYFATYLGAPTLADTKDKIRDQIDQVRADKTISPLEREKRIRQLTEIIQAENFWRDLKRQRGSSVETWRTANAEALI